MDVPLRTLNTEKTAALLRGRAIRSATREILITRFSGSRQSHDLTLPPNCHGVGRLRHFRRHSSTDKWPRDPLPIDPAARALESTPGDVVVAQVFQSAICNWRCWYCFVDFKLLSANLDYATWATCDQLVDWFLEEPNRPQIIDLSGGQPDLTPEWVPWMMRALEARGQSDCVYLWSDDNLSNDYLWRFLTNRDLHLIEGWPNYGRVGCFKGIDPDSFAFNTMAEPSRFFDQFELFGRLSQLDIDLYGYATFPTPNGRGIPGRVRGFLDRLQAVNELLPLRVVPLEIRVFSPTKARMDDAKIEALENQYKVAESWNEELDRRFPPNLRELNIADVPMVRSMTK